MSTVHSLETPLVLESLENFERRIQEISNTLQRCDGQISYLDQRLKNFSVADEVVEAVAEAGLASVFSLSVSSFNEKMNLLENYTRAIEKLLSFVKSFLAVSAKTAYIASIPASVTAAVVAPEMTGKFLTKMEKVKIIALSDGNYDLKFAALEQLASSGNLDASTCQQNAAACEAIEELESNLDQENDFDNKTASTEFNNADDTFAAGGVVIEPVSTTADNAAAETATVSAAPNAASVITNTTIATTTAVTTAVTAAPNAAASIATAAVAATPQAAAAIINAAVTVAPHAAASITSAAVAAIPNAAAAITNAAVSAGGDPGVVALAAITAGADPTLVNDSIAQATVDDVTTNITTPDSTENSSQLSTIVAASVSPS